MRGLGFRLQANRKTRVVDAQALPRERLGEAAGERGGGAGVGVRELACERREALRGGLMVRRASRRPGGAA